MYLRNKPLLNYNTFVECNQAFKIKFLQYNFSYKLMCMHYLSTFLFISYLNSPIMDDNSTQTSFIIPPIDPVKILYINTRGDDIRIVDRTSFGFVNENENVFNIIADVISNDDGPCQVRNTDNINSIINTTIHILLLAHSLSL